MKLLIPAEIEAKLHAYVRAVDTEIAGMGRATITEDGDVIMTDVAIYDQEVTGGTADLSSEALAHFQTDIVRRGDSPKDWIVWWHSHANMAAFFSGTDTATIERSSEFQYLISLVVNKRRERKARLDMYHPFRFTQSDLEIVVGTDEEMVPEEIAAEVAEKVKIKSWVGYGSHHGLGLGKRDADNYGATNGRPKTIGEILSETKHTSADRNEILSVIDVLEQQIKDKLKEKGMNEESPEVVELADELSEWEYTLWQHDKDMGEGGYGHVLDLRSIK